MGITFIVERYNCGFFKMISKLVTLAVGICLLGLNAQAKHYCAEDSDCAALGDLVCTKSQCDWGICGCPRGQVAKFVGSDLKFRCITLKKIGQSCSTSGTGGVCGPEDSICEDNICKCTGNQVSIWDGERCVLSVAGDSSWPGETCTVSGLCQGRNVQCGVQDTELEAGLEGLAGTCSCDPGYKVFLTNDLGETDFLGKRIPTCEPNVYGDFCLTDADCRMASNLICNLETKRCDCEDDIVKPTYSGDCQADTGREFGEECTGEPCNPTMNLECGDVCELDPDEPNKCACAPGYKRDGVGCIAVELNAECVGDYNCKSLGPNAQCVNGQCTSGSITILGSMGLITLGFILSGWF